MGAENKIGNYKCPQCQKNDISFKGMEISLTPPDQSLTHQILRFFCHICQDEFKVEAGVLMYQVSLINILKKRYP